MIATRGSLATRLARLEDSLRRVPSAALPPLDEDGWLAVFERLGREGFFAREPDFPAALAFCRDALDRAHASAHPPFDPPPHFRPDDPHPHVRLQCWRTEARFPDVVAGLGWLGEMFSRVQDGTPPVTEAEFRDLAAWFGENDSWLYELSLPSQLLDVGHGRTTWCANVRFSLARGPRADGAGRVAEDIRQLRARYGERPATTENRGREMQPQESR